MIPLTCAISEYDQVRDLETGRVRAEGISLDLLIMPVEEVFFRSIRFREFDLSEMSMGRYAALVSQPDCPFIAIPVFPSRMFRHSAIYVRTNGPIQNPSDLRGARIGIPEWAQTAGIYVRGILADQYGVSPRDAEWFQGGLREIGREEEVSLQLADGIRLHHVADRTLDEMLLAGDLDAIISAHPPESFIRGNSAVRRLFANYSEVENVYWRETGIFPIMQTIVIRREVFERQRWIATNLLKAFSEAKDRSIARISEVTAARVPIPWMSEYVSETRACFGNDFWPYGIEKNMTTLEAFLRYAFTQGITSRQLQIDDLFPIEVRSQFKI